MFRTWFVCERTQERIRWSGPKAIAPQSAAPRFEFIRFEHERTRGRRRRPRGPTRLPRVKSRTHSVRRGPDLPCRSHTIRPPPRPAPLGLRPTTCASGGGSARRRVAARLGATSVSVASGRLNVTGWQRDTDATLGSLTPSLPWSLPLGLSPSP